MSFSCSPCGVSSAGEDAVQVELFDSRDGFNYRAGAGIQLNGGMAVYQKINPILHKKISDAALPLTKIRSRAKPREWQFPWEKLLNAIRKTQQKESFQTLLEIDLRKDHRRESAFH